MPWMFTKGIMGDKNQMAPDVGKMSCVWHSDCPSHQPFKDAYPPKNRILERVSPYVYKVQCKYCGMIWMQDTSNAETRREMKCEDNPALIGGRKVI